MRLICPNCGAQYEVPDDVIPEAGRDVQCSNCGHTWFETPGGSVAAEGPDAIRDLPDNAAEAALRGHPDVAPDRPAPQPPTSAAEPEPEETPDPALATDTAAPDDLTASDPDQDPIPAPEVDPKPGPGPIPDNKSTQAATADMAIAAVMRGQAPIAPSPTPAAVRPPPAAPEAPAVPRLQRRGLDPAVADILREEAALNFDRRQSSGGLESQPDLGIPDAPPIDPEVQRAQEARRRLALLKGENPNPQPVTRRERLPDIEEINSTLRATSERGDSGHIEAADAAPRQHRGFRLGFRMVILLAVIGFAAYVLAPRISSAVPALEPTMTTYVAKVDDARLWLDAKMRTLLEIISPNTAGPEITTDPAPSVDTAAPTSPEAPAATN